MEHRQNDWDQNFHDPLMPPPPPYMPLKTNGKSIAALVLGILSIMIPYLGFLIGIVAIIFAALALKELKVRMEQGKGLAIAGLVCGIIGTAIYAIIMLILLIVFFAAAAGSSYYGY
ncbi:hypothetical protein PAECIP111890_04845 [Paenibacillus sp. JJ-223]|nr:hypothetical protein PAECIP111890_04845 [Paenibacillus sp. JJ-223]